jgi:16S rRNA (guanine966-N2)-methyltransferase
MAARIGKSRYVSRKRAGIVVAGGRRGHTARGRSGLRNELRIIGGEWRGRRVRFPSLPQLRPSPDRVRETLFNWLAPVIDGARCLDLFAGSGALGLEAASRGASRVVLVDSDTRAQAAISASIGELRGSGIEALCDDALVYLARGGEAFDIVFLDPPFGSGLLAPACAALAGSRRLAAGARVYLEHESREAMPALPAGWTLLRSRRAGHVSYHLAAVGPDGAPDTAE